MEKVDTKTLVMQAVEDAATKNPGDVTGALTQGLIALTKIVAKMQDQVATASDWAGELARRPAFKYVGAWKEGNDYFDGNFATYAGSLWHCERDTKERPGTGYDWKLAVKGMRD